MIHGINFVNICMSDTLACVECFGVPLHCTLVGSNPSREIPLLGSAHPVEGNTISGTEDALGDGTHPGPYRQRNGQAGLILYFFKILGKRPSFV